MHGKKFVFVKDIERLLRQGKTEMILPVGTRFSPAANDLIREEGIRVSFTNSSPGAALKVPKEASAQNEMAERTEASPHGLIAVAAGSRDIHAPVGKTSAEAPFFLIFDIQGRHIDVIKNPYANGGKKVEPLIARLMASAQIAALAAQNFENSLRTHLEANRVQVFEITGSIREAVASMLTTLH